MSAQIMTYLTMSYLRLKEQERGQTLVEYALIIALLVIVVAVAFTTTDIAGKVSTQLSKLGSKLT